MRSPAGHAGRAGGADPAASGRLCHGTRRPCSGAHASRPNRKARPGTTKSTYEAKNGPRIESGEHRIEDIKDRPGAWPHLDHKVALALFFNPAQKFDLDRIKARIDAYTNEHPLSMLGAPDAVGRFRAFAQERIDAPASSP